MYRRAKFLSKLEAKASKELHSGIDHFLHGCEIVNGDGVFGKYNIGLRYIAAKRLFLYRLLGGVDNKTIAMLIKLPKYYRDTMTGQDRSKYQTIYDEVMKARSKK